MKVLTAEQMRQLDRRTMELGIPGLILMENAGCRVVEVMAACFGDLARRRFAILCGKGNNGGDGMVVARQLLTRFRPPALEVALLADPGVLEGDAAANYRMLAACGCPIRREITPEMSRADIVVDALLGTGLKGPAAGEAQEWIRRINSGFLQAKVVAVDLPSGLISDSGAVPGEAVRADLTVTFTAPKPCLVLAPACELAGELHVGQIGSPASLYEHDPAVMLALAEPSMFAELLAPRPRNAHKGDFGHVLVIGGSRSKPGAAAMAGLAALRAGAGLVTVASAASAVQAIASHAPELMTEPLPETAAGGISLEALESGLLGSLVRGKDVVAVGPGLGTEPDTVALVRRLVLKLEQWVVVDADGLNALAGSDFSGKNLILTPHPGEMGRLLGVSTAEVQGDRLAAARRLAAERRATVVLKGQRTLIAFADGRVTVNPTGTPAMATAGSGDILTGLIAGWLAQCPQRMEEAVTAAVYLHGRAGELGAKVMGEQGLIATDLLRFLPEATSECARA